MLFAAVFVVAQPGAPAEKIGFCELVEHAATYHGRVVSIRARLVRLERGEWAIDDSTCVRPVLLVYPVPSQSPSDPLLASSDGVALLRQTQRERGNYFSANFVGRFDVASAGVNETSQRGYGRARLASRLLLIDVVDPIKRFIPQR